MTWQVSAVGADEAGRGLIEHARNAGIDTAHIKVLEMLPHSTHGLLSAESSALPSSTSSSTSTSSACTSESSGLSLAATATYTATHDLSGDLVVAVADVRIVTALGPLDLMLHAPRIADSQLVVIDGNFNPLAFAAVVDCSFAANVPLFFDCTSDHKCLLPVQTGQLNKVHTQYYF